MMFSIINLVNRTTIRADDEYDNLRTKWANYLLGGNYNQNDTDVYAKISTIVTNVQSCWKEVDFSSATTFNTTAIKEYNNRVTGYDIQYWDCTT